MVILFVYVFYMKNSLVDAKQVDMKHSITFINKELIDTYIDNLHSMEVKIQVNKELMVCKMSDLGISINEQSIISKWFMILSSTSLHSEFKKFNLFIIPNELFRTTKLTYDDIFVDKEAMKIYLKEKLKGFNIQAKNATVMRVNNAFQYEEEVIGQSIVLDATIDRILQAFNSWSVSDIKVAAVVSKVIPRLTLSQIESSNELLGTYTTYYTSGSERERNLANGSKFINGYVLYPGEIFSIYKVLAPITSENGYVMANAFSSNKIIRDIGGGVCQLSSTLYNAVLESELEVVERHEHSIQVSYIDVSRDATVTSKYKDFRFRNNTSSTIYIESIVQNGIVTISIYGKENRDIDNRKIVFEVVKKRYITPDIVKVTANDASLYRELEQEGRYGCEAELYKIVYVNGVEIERVMINSSRYAPVEIKSIIVN